MQFDLHKFPVSAEKIKNLELRIQKLAINLRDVEESFTKGSGKGGQKINKTSSAVCLVYPPLQLVVKMSKERSQALNRFLALRELIDQIEMKISPETSSRMKEWEKVRKQKSRIKRRHQNNEPHASERQKQ